MAVDLEALIKRTTAASGVPVVPTDPAALARLAALLGQQTAPVRRAA